MNLPGIPDYSSFIGDFIQSVQSIGLASWFNAAAQAAIVFGVAWSAFLFFTGNRLGAQGTFIRTMIALLLFNLGTRPEGAALRSALYDGWRAAHKSAVRTAVDPIANQLGNALNSLKDQVKEVLVVSSTLALGGFTNALLKGGVRGVQIATKAATEAKGAVGSPTKGVGGMGTFQAVRSVSTKIGWGALTLTVPYVAAMMVSGLMVYISLVLFPLAATALALGYPGLVRSMVTLYLSGLLLGVVAPLVFGASIRMLQNNSIAQIQREVQAVMQQAQNIKQQNEANIQRLQSEVESYAQQMENSTGQQGQASQGFWDRFKDWAGGVTASVSGAINNALTALLTPLNNMLNALTTWLVSGLVSIALFLISTLAIIVGSAWTINRLASAIRV